MLFCFSPLLKEVMVMASEGKSEGSSSVDEQKRKSSCKCGFCGEGFSTVEKLYAHQQDKHDPDGIMFSELGFPK